MPPTAPVRLSRMYRSRRFAAVTAIGALTCAAAAVLVTAAPAGAQASAKYVAGHDPFGAVTTVKAVSTGLQVTGWAADPDARKNNAGLLGIVDGHVHSGAAYTSLKNAAITKKYKLGATPGFTFTIPVPAGKHSVCIVARDKGPGIRKILRCIATPLGRKLTAHQSAARSVKGTIGSFTATSKSVRVQGMAVDPDYTTRPIVMVLYLDRRSAATVLTGQGAAYDITVPVSRGTHVGCLWAVDIGWGSNSFLGCKAADTRGHAGSGKVTQPALNKKVLAEAKKHIGQRYVYGATGPKVFDCSGLVMYSYKKSGYRTPRVSEDQFLHARLIPASRAVPGDLVFYSDSEGDIHHVGIYSGPGMSVAAIDEQEGVDWQRIWPSNTTFYGSFTHI